MQTKLSQFVDLTTCVQNCHLCSRMTNRRKVLGPANGNLDSSVVFIAEAPGRLGADRFGIPLYGDQTGRNFEKLLSSADLNRESVFITNAILCNPRGINGNNTSPSRDEIRNCSFYLRETLAIVKPYYIVTLGTKALLALNQIEPLNVRLSESVGKVYSWNGYKLFPLYHPGPRAFIKRNLAQQVADYRILSAYLDKLRPLQ